MSGMVCMVWYVLYDVVWYGMIVYVLVWYDVVRYAAISARHNYGTSLASKSTFAFPKVRTNYGKFNIRYFGPKI